MQIIIDTGQCPCRELNDECGISGNECYEDDICATCPLIRNGGVKLPEGHGRIIDADAFLKENKDYTGWILCSDAWGGENAYKDTLEDLINEAPTIIGAERRVENADNN